MDKSTILNWHNDTEDLVWYVLNVLDLLGSRLLVFLKNFKIYHSNSTLISKKKTRTFLFISAKKILKKFAFESSTFFRKKKINKIIKDLILELLEFKNLRGKFQIFRLSKFSMDLARFWFKRRYVWEKYKYDKFLQIPLTKISMHELEKI